MQSPICTDTILPVNEVSLYRLACAPLGRHVPLRARPKPTGESQAFHAAANAIRPRWNADMCLVCITQRCAQLGGVWDDTFTTALGSPGGECIDADEALSRLVEVPLLSRVANIRIFFRAGSGTVRALPVLCRMV